MLLIHQVSWKFQNVRRQKYNRVHEGENHLMATAMGKVRK
jgi:hypothetical protein